MEQIMRLAIAGGLTGEMHHAARQGIIRRDVKEMRGAVLGRMRYSTLAKHGKGANVSPGLQAAAAKSFDEAFTNNYNKRSDEAVEKFGRLLIWIV
jgi:hypothetical protein